MYGAVKQASVQVFMGIGSKKVTLGVTARKKRLEMTIPTVFQNAKIGKGMAALWTLSSLEMVPKDPLQRADPTAAK